MTSPVLKLSLLFSVLLIAVFILAQPAVAQQATYYTFDSGPGNYSYSCKDPNNPDSPGGPLPNPLLCLNNFITGEYFNFGSNPSFFNVPYPPNLGGSTHYEMLMNQASPSDEEDFWFSVPQPVTNGFTSYFAFRLTPAPYGSGAGQSLFTADGIAFVIQNAQGGQEPDAATDCQEANYGEGGFTSGPNVVTGAAPSCGCLGYSGIDNSLAVEFDTFQDTWDPGYPSVSSPNNANHISVQSCGSNVNSASHSEGGCQVVDDTNGDNIAINDNNFGVTLADGNVHEAVVDYTGASGTPANQLQVFIDPPFVSGTHTPCPVDYAGCPHAATPAISVIYNIGNHLSPWLGTNNDSAYVGFTASTADSYFEQQELLAWTFTPHSSAQQQQPLQPAGPDGTYTTVFPFGNHTFGVNYQSDNTSGYDMVVTAIPVSPALFDSLVAGTSFDGSQCQIYDGTGGNCIVYSISCVVSGTTGPAVACPPTTDPTQPLIAVKSAYENSIQPTSPGMFQGDPFLAPIASISASDGTATVTCSGECAVHDGQKVNILQNSDTGFNVTGVTVSNSTPDVHTFTFPSAHSGSGTGGYVNSDNLTNIFVSYNPQRIDGTSAGKTKNFSEIVALAVSPQPPAIISGNSASFTAGTYGSFAVTATGNPVPSITQGGASLTGTGLSFVDNGNGTGTLSGTPTSAATSNSPYNITFTAHNTAGPDFVQAFTLYVLPAVGPAQIMVTPGSLDFGYVNLGSSKSMKLTVKNVSSSSLNITKISFSYGGGSGKDYGYTTQCGGALKPGKTCTITVTLKAQDLGPGAALLNILYNQSGSPAMVNLMGTVINPKAKLSVSSLSFGTVKVGQNSTKTVVLSSVGDTPLNISNIMISGSGDFTLSPMNPCPASMPKNTSCTIGVQFAPSAKQSRSGTLKITDNASSSPQTVSLSGKGN